MSSSPPPPAQQLDTLPPSSDPPAAPADTDAAPTETPQSAPTTAPAADPPAQPASEQQQQQQQAIVEAAAASVEQQPAPPAASTEDASPATAPAATSSAAEPSPDAPPAVEAAAASAAAASDHPSTSISSPPATAPDSSTPASASTAAPPPAILSPTPTSAANAPSLALSLSATPSRDASPSSTTSSARLAASGAPAPVKKFSALNVNKKFLETAIASAGKENKESDKTTAAAKGALATGPPTKVPTPTPHPPSRLLTTRPTPALNAAPRPTAAPPSQWGAKSPAPAAPAGGARRESGGAPWAAGGGARDGADGPSWRTLQANFPTTKESLEDREKAAQKAAANAAEASKAEAEHQKAIIQELDSFRGSHLDPNAHHWDEPESDDDDFLDEVVDFGDGKKYTISASPQEPSFAADILEQREKLIAAENAKHGSGARGDFDRSLPHGRGAASSAPHHHAPSAAKPHLFNERNNRLEPRDAGGLPKGRRMSNDPPHRGPAAANANAAPVQPSRPAWGIVRDANGKIVPSLPPSRQLPPHLAAAAALAAAGIPPPAAPAAPPAAAPAAAPAARPSALPARTGGLGTVRSTGGLGEKRASLSAPRGAAVDPRAGAPAKPITSPKPATAQPVAPPTGPAADRRPSHDGLRPAAPAAPAAAAATPAVAVPPVVVEDITELQKDEMHTAAERARLRRQKEEEERTAAQERARQKAKELEARFGPAPSKSAAAQAAKPAPKEIAKKALPTKPSSSPAVPNTSTPVPPTGPSQSRPAKVLQAPQPIKPITSTPVLPPPAPRQQQKAALPRQVTLAAAPPSLKQLLEDGETGGDESHVNFADLGDLIAAEGSPQPAAAQPAAGSRRPAAADFFDRPPTSSGPVLPPPAEVATPRSPEVRAGALPQGKASVDNVLQRIKGVMHPDAPAAQQGAAPVRVVLPSPEPPYTYLPRPPSPSPVWKKFSVKINHDGRQRSPIPAKQLQVDPKRETLRAIDTLSWMPSMYKWLSPSTLSRDDWLLAPPFRKVLGRVAPPPAPVVSLPTKRISDLPVNPLPESPVFQRAVVKLPSAAAPALAVIPPTPARGGQFARSTLESTWRRAPQVGVADPSAAVGGPVNASAEAGAASDSLFAASQGPGTTGAPIIRLRTPPGGKPSSSPRLPHGSVVGFYRDRTPSIGASSDEQMASLVRFTVSSELLDGPGGADAAYDEDVPSFPSLMRPSSTVGAASVASAQDEALELSARSAASAAASALSPPSAATSDAWSKTPMAYSPADRSVLPGLYGGQHGVPASHSPWAAAPAFDASAQFGSPKLAHHSPQQYQQQQHGGRTAFNPYAQQQQQQRYSSPAMGFALPTSSPQPPAANGAIYSSAMNGNAPRFQPSGQQQQPQPHSSTRPDPSARPFVPQNAGGAHHPGLARNQSSDLGSSPYAGASPSPIGSSPYSPGISLPGLPPAIQGGVWVPISMPMGGAGAGGGRADAGYQGSPALAASPLPTPYYTPQSAYQQHQHQHQRQASNLAGGAGGQQQQQGQQPRFRNLSEFSTSSPVFTPQHQQHPHQYQQQQHGAFGAGGSSPFEVRPQPTAAAAAADVKDAVHQYQPSVRAPVFTPSGAGGASGFGKAGPW